VSERVHLVAVCQRHVSDYACGGRFVARDRGALDPAKPRAIRSAVDLRLWIAACLIVMWKKGNHACSPTRL
jgi:hypothetical protein